MSQHRPETSEEFNTEEIQSVIDKIHATAEKTPENMKAGDVFETPTNDTIIQLEESVKEWENTAKRYAADLKNQANQHSLDLQQTRKTIKKITLGPVLDFLNTLNLAFSFAPDTQDEKVLAFISTLSTSFTKIKSDLATQGYEVIQPNIGDEFDPIMMNALNQHNEDNHPTVKHIVSLGCKIDNVVITPSMVML